VRFRDLDRFNHVTNVAYFEYLECARVEYLRPLKSFGSMLVARAELDYVSEIPGGTRTVDVTVGVERIGTTSFVFRYEIRNGETLCAVGRSVQVVVGDDHRPRRLSSAERSQLEALLWPA
jgi:acyl-CoA thioester hydrolase